MFLWAASTENEKLLNGNAGYTAGNASVYLNSKGTKSLVFNSIIWESVADPQLPLTICIHVWTTIEMENDNATALKSVDKKI